MCVLSGKKEVECHMASPLGRAGRAPGMLGGKHCRVGVQGSPHCPFRSWRRADPARCRTPGLSALGAYPNLTSTGYSPTFQGLNQSANVRLSAKAGPKFRIGKSEQKSTVASLLDPVAFSKFSLTINSLLRSEKKESILQYFRCS